MADPIGLAGSIIGIVAFGLKLGTTLQTWLELASEAEDWMRDIIFDVNTTASVLRQLQEIIDDDRLAAKQQNRPMILKAEGLDRIQGLAKQCDKTYKAIIVLVYKASSQKSEKKTTVPDPIDLSLISLRSLTLLNKLRWPWLEPKARRCREDLRWLKVSLLLQLQIVNLSHLHLDKKTNVRQTGTFHEELGFRVAAEKLRQRQVSMAKNIAKTRKGIEKGTEPPSSERPTPPSNERLLSTAPSTNASAVSLSPANNTIGATSFAGAVPLAPGPPPPLPTTKISPGPGATNTGKSHSLPFNDSAPKANASCGSTIVDKDESISSRKIGTHDAVASSSNIPNLTDVFMATSLVAHTTKGSVPPVTAKSPPADDTLGKKVEKTPEAEEPATADPNLKSNQLSLPESTEGASSIHSNKANLPKFSLRNYFRRPDFPSADLEAWVIVSNDLDNVPEKLGFGHQRLNKSIKRLEKGNLNISLHLMTPTQRAFAEKMSNAARHSSPHLRTCLGIEEQKEPGRPGKYIAYFSLGEPQLPLYFTDSLGQKFMFPFEAVKLWEDMQSMIRQILRSTYDRSNERSLDEGRFDLVLESPEQGSQKEEQIILPAVWNSTIKPGARVRIRFKLLSIPPPPPPWGFRNMVPPPPAPLPRPPYVVPASVERPMPAERPPAQTYIPQSPSPIFGEGVGIPPGLGSTGDFDFDRFDHCQSGDSGRQKHKTASDMLSFMRGRVINEEERLRGEKERRERRERMLAEREARDRVNMREIEERLKAEKQQKDREREAAAAEFKGPAGGNMPGEGVKPGEVEGVEDEELGVVDFEEVIKEAEEGSGDAVAEMLRRYTNISEEKIDWVVVGDLMMGGGDTDD
ncbi:hypothetical protein QBC43DRAFT_317341 [Cladorrhinum sp. PSN259]|nr:hypothetical protein QBC43DRAFT_317341 [Cladorrhinum sp. PSN259]